MAHLDYDRILPRSVVDMPSSGIRKFFDILDSMTDVTAMIEVKMTPQRDRGFDRIAEKIYQYPEVQSVYLMSGGYDLCLIIEGRTMKEVAYFVAQKLAPIESVISTATHFVLRKYKDKGVIYGAPEVDERGNFI